MFCPFCHTIDTKVIDSRLTDDGSQVKRRRHCLECQERFNTFEVAELNIPFIIKRDGRREPFSIDNLRNGMQKALQKRPVSTDDVEHAISEILKKIRHSAEREISAQTIGQLVMEALYNLDHVAYVRFASVYKRFEDVSDFQQAIDEMKQ